MHRFCDSGMYLVAPLFPRPMATRSVHGHPVETMHRWGVLESSLTNLQSQPRNTQPCPTLTTTPLAVNCLMSAFAPVGICSSTCGGWLVTVGANGRSQCIDPSTNSHTVVMPVNCIMTVFIVVGSCGCYQLDVRTVVTPAVNGGAACHAHAYFSKSEVCNTQACPTEAPHNLTYFDAAAHCAAKSMRHDWTQSGGLVLGHVCWRRVTTCQPCGPARCSMTSPVRPRRST